MPFARALANAGGGNVVSQPRAAWQDNLEPVFARQSLSTWLWLLALLLLPVDIGVRRLIVSRRDLAAIRLAFLGIRRPTPGGAPAVAPLDTLRRQRTARSAGPARQVSPAPSMTASAQVRSETARVRVPTPKPPSKPAGQVTARPEPAASEPGAAGTTSQLLAAKRRRK